MLLLLFLHFVIVTWLIVTIGGRITPQLISEVRKLRHRKVR